MGIEDTLVGKNIIQMLKQEKQKSPEQMALKGVIAPEEIQELNGKISRYSDRIKNEVVKSLLGKGDLLPSLKTFDADKNKYINSKEFISYVNYLDRIIPQIADGKFSKLNAKFPQQKDQLKRSLKALANCENISMKTTNYLYQHLVNGKISLEDLENRVRILDAMKKIEHKDRNDAINLFGKVNLSQTTITTTISESTGGKGKNGWMGIGKERTISLQKYVQILLNDSSIRLSANQKVDNVQENSRATEIQNMKIFLRSFEQRNTQAKYKDNLDKIYGHLAKNDYNSAMAEFDILKQEFKGSKNFPSNPFATAHNLGKALRALGDTTTAEDYLSEGGLENKDNKAVNAVIKKMDYPPNAEKMTIKAEAKYLALIEALEDGSMEKMQMLENRDQVIEEIAARLLKNWVIKDYIKENGSQDLPPAWQDLDDMKGLNGFWNFTDENKAMTKEIAIMVASTIAVSLLTAGVGGIALNAARAAVTANRVGKGLKIAKVVKNTADALNKGTKAAKAAKFAVNTAFQAAAFTATEQALRDVVGYDTWTPDQSLMETFGKNMLVFTAFGVGTKFGQLINKKALTQILTQKNLPNFVGKSYPELLEMSKQLPWLKQIG
nr:hypothetical protein [Candidatus Gracilibacteria bacterium]